MKPLNGAATTVATMTSQARTIKVAQTVKNTGQLWPEHLTFLAALPDYLQYGEDREHTTAPVPGACQNGGEELTPKSRLLSNAEGNLLLYPP